MIEKLCNGVIPFIWNRLPLDSVRAVKIPCLAEDWFVEDAILNGSPFVWRDLDRVESHRRLYRYAKERAWERGEYGTSPQHLLLHQMTILFPALVVKTLQPSFDRKVAS